MRGIHRVGNGGGIQKQSANYERPPKTANYGMTAVTSNRLLQHAPTQGQPIAVSRNDDEIVRYDDIIVMTALSMLRILCL